LMARCKKQYQLEFEEIPIAGKTTKVLCEHCLEEQGGGLPAVLVAEMLKRASSISKMEKSEAKAVDFT